MSLKSDSEPLGLQEAALHYQRRIVLLPVTPKSDQWLLLQVGFVKCVRKHEQELDVHG